LLINNGKFDVIFRFKSLTSDDTISVSGTCFFYKKDERNPIADFVIFQDAEPSMIYNGGKFFELFPIEEKANITEIYNGELSNVLRGNIKMQLVVPTLLSTVNPFLRQEYDENTQAKYFESNGYYEIIRREPDINNVVADPVTRIIIDSQTFLPAKIINDLDFQNMHQYSEYIFSLIINLGDTANANLKLDTLLAHYLLKENRNDEVVIEPSSLKEGDSLPDFQINYLNKLSFNINQIQAELVLIDFWYKACYPCLLASKCIESVYKDFEENKVSVIGINSYDKDINSLKSFLQKRGVTYPIALDSTKSTAKKFNVTGYPSIFLLDMKSKKVLYSAVGYSDKVCTEINDKIQRALSKKGDN
jgi:peroxiredoxin